MRKYAVLLKEVEGVDISKVSDALAKAKKMPLFEARKKMGGLSGIVSENLDEVSARKLVLQLRNNGIRSSTIEMEKMIELPSPIAVRSGRISDELLYLEGSTVPRNVRRWNVKWDNILLLACARVRREEIVRKMDIRLQEVIRPVVGMGGGGVGVRPVLIEKKVSRDKWVNLLDIISSEPRRLFRIEAESFNFLSLGLLKLMPAHFQNLVQFIHVLVGKATRAFIDPSIRFILDGNPLTNLRTPSLESYENRVKWALQSAALPARQDRTNRTTT